MTTTGWTPDSSTSSTSWAARDLTNNYIGDLRSSAGNHLHTTSQALLYANLPEEDLLKYSDYIPLTDDGKPKPIDEWDAADKTKWGEGLNGTGLAVFNEVGENGRKNYIDGFDESKSNLEQYMKK